MIFREWFLLKPLASGDWPFLFEETIKEFSWIPKNQSGKYFALEFFYRVSAKFMNKLGFSWFLTEKIVWFWPFLILTVFSSWYLIKILFPKNKLAQILAPFIYLFNTYILMVVGGGQMGVAMAYSLAPMILAKFITGSPLFVGLLLAIQIMFDPRISLITFFATFIYFLFQYKWELKKYLKNLLLPVIISLGLHLIWIIPAMISKAAFIPENYQQSGWLGFLSVAEFSKTLSLLHPNWPENIFGKIYLMKPEFLILPILAYFSLIFLPKEKKIRRIILFFVFLGLLGAFLTKGTNPPFGEVYRFFFQYFPPMKFFRDASKFYLLVALSYSVLIPFSTSEISNFLFKKARYLSNLFLLFTICYLFFLIKPAILGQLGGTFKSREVPQEYLVLKDFLYQQKESFSIFWVPYRQRFGFSSESHSALSVNEWVEDDKCLEPFCSLKITKYNREYFRCHKNEKCYPADASFLANSNSLAELIKMRVKYLIIPFDSEEEIFFYERKYDREARQNLEQFLDSISWFKKVSVTEKIAVYELTN